MTVTVTGSGITDTSKVQLIGYTGDDIAFLETGAVGRLYCDYTYDTLRARRPPPVILVTYREIRGSPVSTICGLSSADTWRPPSTRMGIRAKISWKSP